MRKLLIVLAAVFLAGLPILADAAQAGDTLQLTHQAFNDTKNRVASEVLASREDYITYTLKAHNPTNQPVENFVFRFDASGILPLADSVDTGGGAWNGNILTYPATTIWAYQTQEMKLRVRVKAFLPPFQYLAQSHFGNEVRVVIEAKSAVAGAQTPPPVAPNTGALSLMPWIIGLAAAGGYGVLVRKKIL